MHPNAQIAAEAAEAAAAQGSFWEMHDRLLAHQDDARAGRPLPPRRRPRPRPRPLREDLRRRRYAPRVAEDVQSADASGVSGTPTFFINGRRHQGVYDIDTLAREVKAAAQTAIVRS